MYSVWYFSLVVWLYCYLFSSNWGWFPHESLSMLQYFCVCSLHLDFLSVSFARLFCHPFALHSLSSSLEFPTSSIPSSIGICFCLWIFYFVKATVAMHFKWSEKVKNSLYVSVSVQVLLDRKYFSRSITIRKNTYYQNCVRVYTTLISTWLNERKLVMVKGARTAAAAAGANKK